MARQMKDSGIAWIGEIPDNWNTIKIKQLQDYSVENSFIDGDWIESPYITDAGIRYLTTGNVGDGRFKEQGNGFITEETFHELNCKYAYPDDFVIARLNAPYGRACILPATHPRYVLAVDIVILRTEHDKRYLCYVTQCEGYQRAIEDEAKGTTMKRISRTNLGNIALPIAPLAEQHRIADFLDRRCAEIDAVMERTKATIEEYKKLKQAVITEAVTKGVRGPRKMKDSGIEWIGEIPEGWEVSRVKYVSDFEPSSRRDDLSDESIITYTPMDCIKNGWFINNTAPLGSVSSSLTAYQEGDIVLAKVTPCFENGNIAIMKGLASGFGLGSSELFVIRTISIDTKYMFYWLQNKEFMQQACATMTGTGGLKRVSPSFVKDCFIHMPSSTEQAEIAAYLDEKCSALDTLIARKTALLTELEAYKKSLIYEYVTGKKEVPACQ